MIDIHTHLPAPRPESVISCSPTELPPAGLFPHQLYSVGFHPWSSLEAGTSDNLSPLQEALLSVGRRNDVVAIGECGIDTLRGGLLYDQRRLFEMQAVVAEELQLPMVIHCVKAPELIIAAHKKLKPRQAWAIHGFRGKPSVAEMMLREGLWLSFGEKFNADTLRCVAPDRMLVETDESRRPIEEIVSEMATALGIDAETLTTRLSQNAAHFLNLRK